MIWTRLFFCSALFAFLPTVGLAMDTELQKRSYHQGDRVAIIGAGVCGLAVARGLIDAGVDPQKIEIVEKAAYAGGKVRTVMVDGRPFELGAQIVVPEVYEPIMKLIKKYGLSLRKPDGGGNFDLRTGELAAKMSPKDEVEFLKEMAVYEYKYRTKWKSISEPLGLAQIPDELNMSWLDFIKAEGFQKIHEVSSGFIGGSGYLQADAPPQAAQILRMLTPPNLMNAGLHGSRLFNSGFQQLWKLEAKDLENLGVRFHYNTEVLQISRQAKVSMISTRGLVNSVEAEHVFFTGNLAYLPKLLPDVTPTERNLFAGVVNNDYRSYILRIKGLANHGKSGSFGFLPNTVVSPFNHAVLSVKPYADSDVHVFYAYGAPQATDEDVLEGITSDLALLHAKITEVIMGQKWDYFPHVTSDIGVFFRGILNNQGRGGLWIAGEATSFTTTIAVYEQGRDFASIMVQGKN